VIAACVTVLTRQIHAAGMDRAAALEVLRDAPDKIDAALTRGARALIVYRMDGNKPAGIVSDNDARLERFTADAESNDAPMIGLNPYLVACMAAEMQGLATLKQEGAHHAASTLH